ISYDSPISGLNQPATHSIGRLNTRYLAATPNSFAAISMNSLPVGGSGGVGRCHTWFHADSRSASKATPRAASGIYVSEWGTAALTNQDAVFPFANGSKTRMLGTPCWVSGP